MHLPSSSDSGFSTENTVLLSKEFTEISPLYTSAKGHSRLMRAQRMGKWFVLKCLKEERCPDRHLCLGSHPARDGRQGCGHPESRHIVPGLAPRSTSVRRQPHSPAYPERAGTPPGLPSERNLVSDASCGKQPLLLDERQRISYPTGNRQPDRNACRPIRGNADSGKSAGRATHHTACRAAPHTAGNARQAGRCIPFRPDGGTSPTDRHHRTNGTPHLRITGRK